MLLRLPYITLLLVAIAGAVYHISSDAALHLQFDRGSLAAGQVWRFLSCHLTHFDANHLLWDAGALLVLGSICEAISRFRTVLALALAGIAIPAGVAMFQPQFETYRGLSGLDSALFGLFAATLLEQRRRSTVIIGAFALLVILLKSAFEISTGTTAFAAGTGYAPVPHAHLIGVLCGAGAVWIRSIFRRPGSCSTTPPPCLRSRSSPVPAPPASC